MKFDLILQCRFNSTRLKGKILKPINKNCNSIDLLVQNFKKKFINKIIIAVPHDTHRYKFFKIAKNKKINFFSSKKIKENDLLKRFFFAAKNFKSQNIIRITSDCPFANPYLVKKMIDYYKKNKLQFLTNNHPRYVPQGLDCEIFSFNILSKAYQNTELKEDMEHVTPWIRRNVLKQNINTIKLIKKNYSDLRVTLDYKKDYEFMKKKFNYLIKLSKTKNLNIFLKKFYKRLKSK